MGALRSIDRIVFLMPPRGVGSSSANITGYMPERANLFLPDRLDT